MDLEGGYSMTNSRRKGAEYEREVARLFRSFGLTAWRGQQYNGANGDQDIVVPGMSEYHFELKRRGKQFSAADLYKAMLQAERDARPGETPAVIHRIDGEGSLITFRLRDWLGERS